MKFKRLFKNLLFSILGLLSLIILIYLVYLIKWNVDSSKNEELLGKVAPFIENKGNPYRDLNKNGKLDVYENKEESIQNRVEDLISQMTIEEKAGTIFINMIGVNEDGSLMEHPTFSDPFSFLMGSSLEMIAKKHMNHFNIRASHDKEKMVAWHNTIQKVGERTRLGIPITIATDPRHGVPDTFGASIYTPYFSKWPSPLGLGATRDSTLVYDHAKIVSEEYKALGIRVALGPMADIASEPRWTRINGTFGEDAFVNAKLTAAYIKGIQGDTLGTHSVAAMVKHFPGSGPLDDGKDSHFPPGYQSYKGGNFDYHLIPFEAAFNAGVSSVMPYYSVPKGITSEDVAAGYNKDLIKGILRDGYNFDGIICTDWGIISDIKPFGMMFKPASAHGVEHLSTVERLEKIIAAGVDMIGGESLSLELANSIHSKKISEERIDESLRRILKQKFLLGLFDNPYLKSESHLSLDNKANITKGIEAQKKSLVLLKNETEFLPLPQKTKVYLHGFDESKNLKIEVSTLENAEVIIVKLKTPSGDIETESIMEKLFGGGRLNYSKEELAELIPLFKSKPTVVVVNLQRPAILTEIEPFSKAIIADFDVAEGIILDLIFGKFAPTGTLPIELPSSMQSVLDQKEDLPYDSENPLFEFGHGLKYTKINE